MEAGNTFRCLGSGSGAGSFSSSSSPLVPNSSSVVGSLVSLSDWGAKNPVRYQRDGADGEQLFLRALPRKRAHEIGAQGGHQLLPNGGRVLRVVWLPFDFGGGHRPSISSFSR